MHSGGSVKPLPSFFPMTNSARTSFGSNFPGSIRTLTSNGPLHKDRFAADSLDADVEQAQGGEAHRDLPFPVGQLAGHPEGILVEFVFPPCRGKVKVAVVVDQHPLRVEAGDEGLHRALDHGDHSFGEARHLAVVEEGDHAVLQERVEGLAVLLVGVGRLFGFPSRRDRSSSRSFRPTPRPTTRRRC